MIAESCEAENLKVFEKQNICIQNYIITIVKYKIHTGDIFGTLNQFPLPSALCITLNFIFAIKRWFKKKYLFFSSQKNNANFI